MFSVIILMLYNTNMQKLHGQTVLITGSSRGIGAETALAFAKEGCNVVITFFEHVGKAEEIERRCKQNGASSVELVHLDLKSNSSIRSALKNILLKYGGIDYLINNAGVIRWKKFAEQTDDDIKEQIETNLMGTIMLTKQSLDYIRDGIINVVGGAGSHPVADLSIYCATKYGVRGFTEVLALENPNLSIYSVSPTMASTEMTDYHGMPPEKIAHIIVQAAKDGYGKPNGSDIGVWEMIKDSEIAAGK